MKIKNLIVGAGISGIVIAERLASHGEQVLILEKRGHIGGNCYDYLDDNGILIHKYGPHIFHTDLEDVWEYMNRFSEFTDFQHKVVGTVDGKLLPIPFNLNSLEIAFPPDQAKSIENDLLKYYEYGSRVSIVDLRKKAQEESNQNLSFIADYIFEKVFKNYTIKQWGISAEEINEDVLRRVPVIIGHDDRYFPHHRFQGMPRKGYTRMFERMLDNPLIEVRPNTDYHSVIESIDYERLFFTGPIDEYFSYRYGKLEYRKTLYQLEGYDVQSYQPNIVVNYPNEHEYTRITEFKKFYPDSPVYSLEHTVICKEIPGVGEVEAYPVETPENLTTLEKYKVDAGNLENVFFLGRLASYRYLDMDKTIKNVLDLKI